MSARSAEPAEIDQLAVIWHDGWHDAHARLVPPELVRERTLESFRDRIAAGLGRVRAFGPPGEPVGFAMIHGDELYQLYVAAPARGSGAAATLLADAEARLADRGVTTAWLACAIGNDRAARFYEKHGWRRVGTVRYQAEVRGGTFPLDVWRYEKALTRGGSQH